ncbi:hypothetical protein [Donghicola tyrosinivorans]|uniref:DUF2946 family protein n=1 Tax=Donghicola tyrosinivorans TaxID=1652492 RepID=A0A2T0X0Q1_9RHOB|nr:hypothetical protein [Donghicola tyrosinivorans]PRY92497.1 hypothetical protein CLV74_102412 [Donghicola tyrosinivorans]
MLKTRVHILSLVLAMLMAFTAVHMGFIRGQAPAVGQITLCTGHGPVDIQVDADGNPTKARYCPECALHLLAAAAPWQPTAAHSTSAQALTYPVTGTHAESLSDVPSRARGPPAMA